MFKLEIWFKIYLFNSGYSNAFGTVVPHVKQYTSRYTIAHIKHQIYNALRLDPISAIARAV